VLCGGVVDWDTQQYLIPCVTCCLRVITNAVSLGHDESLIVFIGENDERQYLYPDEFHNGFSRLSIGLEDTEDVIADLRQAFGTL
jgi:methionine-gamma-lyase